ncbi:MAG TPA: hypothetical protein VFV37_03600 [Luteibaculaceae bacterium]|nr:hypothetical protein [Luteibaculaceae bacterium]
MKHVRRLLVLSVGIAALGCNRSSPKPENIISEKVVENNVQVNIYRLDTAVFAAAKQLDTLAAYHRSMLAEPRSFYRTYLANILQVLPDSNTVFSLYRFAGNRQFRSLQTEIAKAYPANFSQREKLQQAVAKLNRWFPNKPVPEIYLYNSGFNVGIWPDTSVIGIGLEWYLGEKHPVVKSLPPDFPQWQRANMNPDYMVQDAIKGWLLVNTYRKEVVKNVMAYLCFYGKVLYVTEAAVGEVADSTLHSYSAAQMSWAYAQEKNAWKELVGKNLLFSTKERDITRLTSDGPFTPGLPQDSPPMMGAFIGYKMVADYMNKFPNTSVQDLFYKVADEEIVKAYKGKR